jgi:hypothetical protein
MDTGTALLIGGGLFVASQCLQTAQLWLVGRRIARSVDLGVERVAQSLRPPPRPAAHRARSLAELREQIDTWERENKG